MVLAFSKLKTLEPRIWELKWTKVAAGAGYSCQRIRGRGRLRNHAMVNVPLMGSRTLASQSRTPGIQQGSKRLKSNIAKRVRHRKWNP